VFAISDQDDGIGASEWVLVYGFDRIFQEFGTLKGPLKMNSIGCIFFDGMYQMIQEQYGNLYMVAVVLKQIVINGLRNDQFLGEPAWLSNNVHSKPTTERNMIGI